MSTCVFFFRSVRSSGEVSDAWVALGNSQWFPMPYYGDEKQGGVNGHYYHVFNTVRCILSTLHFRGSDDYYRISLCIIRFLRALCCSVYSTCLAQWHVVL